MRLWVNTKIITYSTNYPSDVTDEEWELCAPYLTLMSPNAPQRRHCMRAVFNAARYFVKTGCPWRYLPSDFPPYHTVFQQVGRWLEAGVLEAMAADLRMQARSLEGRREHPSAMIADGRTVQSMPESGARAGYDGYKKKRGSKVHIAVDTIGNLLALVVTPANEQERAQIGELCRQAQEECGDNLQIAWVDQGYTGEEPAKAALEHGVELVVVKLPKSKDKGKGGKSTKQKQKQFILLPRRWVVERTFGWFNRFRRLARDYERTAKRFAGYHWIAAVMLGLRRTFNLFTMSLTSQSA